MVDCSDQNQKYPFSNSRTFFPEIGDIQIINTQIRYHGQDDTAERVEKDGLGMALEQQARERDSCATVDSVATGAGGVQ